MRILISAGHSDVDPGAVTRTHKEADVVLDMRNRIAQVLIDAGHDVITDGDSGENYGLKYAIAQIPQADVAIELHCNASTNKAATGVEVVALPKDRELAQALAAAIASVTGQRLRGDHGWIDQSQTARGRAGFVGAGGLIVELVFLTNEADMADFDEARPDVAQAIADVLIGLA